MKYFREILRANRWWVSVYWLCGCGSAFLGAYGASFLARVLDEFGSGQLNMRMVLLYGVILGGDLLLEYLDNVPDILLENRIYLSFKLMALRKMSTVSFRAQQKFGAGGLIQRIENGAQAGRGMLYSFWLRMLRELVPELIFSLVFIDRINRGILGYIVIGYALVFLISNLLLKYLYRIKARILDNEELLNHHLVRGLMELTVFRTNRRYRAEIERAERAADQVVGAKISMRMVHEAFFTLFALLVVGIKIVVLVFGWRGGGLSVGAVVALIQLIDHAYVPIAIGNVLYVQYKLDVSAFARFGAFLDLPDDPRLSAGEAVRLSGGAVQYADVRVDYEGRAALRGVTLDVPAGRSVALVGESGSGKSTLAKLAAGLILPDGGIVTVDGRDLVDVSLDDYYRFISYMPQEAPVFQGTLRENMALDRDIADEDLLLALRAAELWPLYCSMSDGLDTQIGERGVLMSGGERQRLALSRLYLSDARLVILDEATSALDNATEKLVMGRLLERLRGRTLLVIAHRLSSVVGVDEIVAMRDGQIVEQGVFEQLMERRGYFYELWIASKIAEQRLG